MNPVAQRVCEAYPLTSITALTPLGNGRHNTTFRVEAAEGSFVLQKMNASLGLGVMEDMRSVSDHLARHEILTPRVIATDSGALIQEDQGEKWRLTTYINGTTIESNPTEAQIKSAAQFAGRFHSALMEYDKPFLHKIPEVLNPQRAFNELQATMHTYKDSDKNTACNELRNIILSKTHHFGLVFDTLPLRVVHGDLKLNNFRFDASGENAIALIDLDTLGRYLLPFELGDMLRSWCTVREETTWSLNTETWKQALREYRAHAKWITQAEWDAVPDGFLIITLALAARYLTDAYEERYFTLDPVYANLFEQNLTRARLYMTLLDDFFLHEQEIRALTAVS